MKNIFPPPPSPGNTALEWIRAVPVAIQRQINKGSVLYHKTYSDLKRVPVREVDSCRHSLPHLQVLRNPENHSGKEKTTSSSAHSYNRTSLTFRLDLSHMRNWRTDPSMNDASISKCVWSEGGRNKIRTERFKPFNSNYFLFQAVLASVLLRWSQALTMLNEGSAWKTSRLITLPN